MGESPGLDPREEFSRHELQLAARNHGIPLEALRYDITPLGLHYLLIHYDIPTVNSETWRLEVGGAVDHELSLSLDDIRARPARTLHVTMECAGNGRAHLSPRPISQPWLASGPVKAMNTAFSVARPGSMVGYVGVPHGVELPVEEMFFRNKGALGGSAPVRAYIPELLDDVLEDKIDPGRVLDFGTDLDGIAEAYAAMDERRAIKSLVRVGAV